MDIYHEINLLPNFGYIIDKDDGKCDIVVLGGHTPSEKVDKIPDHQISYLLSKISAIYAIPNPTRDDKIALAKLMIRMRNTCDLRQANLYTPAEQKAYISTLSANEKERIIEQIKMYKQSRIYYKDYLY